MSFYKNIRRLCCKNNLGTQKSLLFFKRGNEKLDKDLDMVKGWHYNFVKHEKYYITAEEGMLNFYTQILTGDKVDNIQGVYRCGPKKAEKLLRDCETELDMWEAVVEAHGSEERALEDARLLWMQTKEGELWLPPNQREE